MAIQIQRRKRLAAAMLVSMGFHFMMLFFLAGNDDYRWPVKADREHSPRALHFEIVETPPLPSEDAPESPLVSDRSLRARDMSPQDRGTLPFSQGNSPVKESSEPSPSAAESEYLPRQPLPPVRSISGVEFSPELLTGKTPPRSRASTMEQNSESPPESGSIRLNTYAWDYAPYLLEMKRRIEKNLYPPTIFTRMGIGGSNVVRFRIDGNGVLSQMETLKSKGEKVLVETSRKAIQLSAPFRPLPEDFPEPYLEVTATFYYIGIDR